MSRDLSLGYYSEHVWVVMTTDLYHVAPVNDPNDHHYLRMFILVTLMGN